MSEIKDFTLEEIKQIKYALEYLHDADLSDYGETELLALESAMSKLDIDYESQL